MLIPKILTTFLTLLFSIISLSLIYFILQHLPKAQATIEYRLIEENPFSTHLCQFFIFSNEISELIKKIISKEDLENTKSLLLNKLSFIFENRGFEIVLDGESIKKGILIYNDVYKCIFFYEGKEHEIIIKIWSY